MRRPGVQRLKSWKTRSIGAAIRFETVTIAMIGDDATLLARAVIVASGAEYRKPSIDNLRIDNLSDHLRRPPSRGRVMSTSRGFAGGTRFHVATRCGDNGAVDLLRRAADTSNIQTVHERTRWPLTT
jgi:hypothetical protein